MDAWDNSTSDNFILNDKTVEAAVNMTGEYSSSYTEQVLSSMYLIIQLIIIPACNIVPLVTNVINMKVLYNQGLNNCVNLCLFCLSAADLTAMAAAIGFIAATYLIHFDLRPGIDPFALYFVSLYVCSSHYDTANTLTAFLSFERCLCVALPLKFKDIITFRRGAAAIFLIYFGVQALYIPHYLSYRVTYLQDEVNSTRYLGLQLLSNRAEVDQYLDAVVHLGLTSFDMIVVCVFTQAMIASLRRSSRFQNRHEKNDSLTNEKEEAKPNVDNSYTNSDINDQRNCDGNSGIETSDKNIGPQATVNTSTISTNSSEIKISHKATNHAHKIKPKPSSTSSRNQTAMNIVIRLCIVCFVCNVPRLAVTVGEKLVPEFNFHRELELWHQLGVSLTYATQLINCSLNIVVYYRYNRSFRGTLNKIFCRSCTGQNIEV